MFSPCPITPLCCCPSAVLSSNLILSRGLDIKNVFHIRPMLGHFGSRRSASLHFLHKHPSDFRAGHCNLTQPPVSQRPTKGSMEPPNTSHVTKWPWKIINSAGTVTCRKASNERTGERQMNSLSWKTENPAEVFLVMQDRKREKWKWEASEAQMIIYSLLAGGSRTLPRSTQRSPAILTHPRASQQKSVISSTLPAFALSFRRRGKLLTDSPGMDNDQLLLNVLCSGPE